MTQRYITTVYNKPKVAKFVRTRHFIQDDVCSDYSEHNPAVSPQGLAHHGGKLAQLLTHWLSLFSRKRTDPVDYSGGF